MPHFTIQLTVLFIALLAPRMLLTGLVIDGYFDDWNGQMNVTDPSGDGPTPNTDVLTFYWGTNLATDPGDEYVYWMMERDSIVSGNPRAYYYVFLDTNNNGSNSDEVDRKIQVFYDPQRASSEVTITVMTGTGAVISTYSGDWGDSVDEGGTRCEWRVSLADLGMDAHQSVSMSAGASTNSGDSNIDTLPNPGEAPITLTPIPVLGWFWLAILIVGVGLFTWRRYGSKVWQTT